MSYHGYYTYGHIKLFDQSHRVFITPLTINVFGGGHTYTHTDSQTHTYTHARTHTNVLTKAISRNKEHVGLQPAHNWFKNMIAYIRVLFSHLVTNTSHLCKSGLDYPD